MYIPWAAWVYVTHFVTMADFPVLWLLQSVDYLSGPNSPDVVPRIKQHHGKIVAMCCALVVASQSC